MSDAHFLEASWRRHGNSLEALGALGSGSAVGKGRRWGRGWGRWGLQGRLGTGYLITSWEGMRHSVSRAGRRSGAQCLGNSCGFDATDIATVHEDGHSCQGCSMHGPPWATLGNLRGSSLKGMRKLAGSNWLAFGSSIGFVGPEGGVGHGQWGRWAGCSRNSHSLDISASLRG